MGTDWSTNILIFPGSFSVRRFEIQTTDYPRFGVAITLNELIPEGQSTPREEPVAFLRDWAVVPVDAPGLGQMQWLPQWIVEGDASSWAFAINVPLWISLVLVAIPTGLVWWGWFRTRRRAAIGGCLACGYDLSGVPTGVCPECGRTEA
jgi:hypothetical protein